MDKYTNKKGTLTVEAAQVTEDNASEISNWANGAQIIEEKDAITGVPVEGLNIKTPNGMMRASLGAFVIKYGSVFTVVSAQKFLSVYSPVVGTTETAEIIEKRPVVKDPWEGMTRMNEGPKP